MAKQRHNEPPPETASRAPLAMMAIGALLVAGLIVWALTRTVETSSPAPSVSSTISPSSDTSATLVPPIDSTVSVVPPIDTVVNDTAPPVRASKTCRSVNVPPISTAMRTGFSVSVIESYPRSCFDKLSMRFFIYIKQYHNPHPEPVEG